MNRSPYLRFGIIAAIAALALVLLLMITLGTGWFFAWIAGWSVVTFVLYGLDKTWSKSGHERVPELVLHGLALIGGFPGGWAGRAVFHHKTRHRSFLIVLIISTVLYTGIAVWLLLR